MGIVLECNLFYEVWFMSSLLASGIWFIKMKAIEGLYKFDIGSKMMMNTRATTALEN